MMYEATSFECSRIAQDLQIRKVQVESVVQLFNEGNTVPFITRYRKERTGGLDEDVIRQVQTRLNFLKQLNDRKQTILKSIETQGKMTEELRHEIFNAPTVRRLEDLYLPFKAKKKSLANAAREKGLEPIALAIWHSDPVAGNLDELLPSLVNPEKQVNTIADLQGLKIRTGGGIAEAVAKALGMSAFVKPAPESFELLNSGVADGVFFPFESIVSFKLESVIGQATVFPGGMYSSAFGYFMNEDKWNKIPKPDQDIITKHSGEYMARFAGKSWDKADGIGIEALKKANVKVVNADAALLKEVQTRSAPIIDDWINKANAKGVDGAKVLAEFHEELKKVAAGK